MSPSPDGRPRVLLVGGGVGLVGRYLRAEFASDHTVRSLHRHPTPAESADGGETIAADIATYDRWPEALADVDLVVNVAWYRAGPRRRFTALADGLLRMLDAAGAAEVPRIVQISVPAAPGPLERTFPYLTEKRRVDAAALRLGRSVRVVRPTMLFGQDDVLLGVMRRTMRRYGVFPMFGDGSYHVSPIAARDLARIVRIEAESARTGAVDVGGPHRYEYRDLTDRLFRSVGRPPRYWRMRPSNGVRLARLLETFGSRLLYAYEVEWLTSDLLGLPAYEGLPGGLLPVERYLDDPSTGATAPRAAPPVRP